MAEQTVDIGRWLEDNGFGEYRTLFAEHDIDGDVLSYLTELDLSRLGLPLGRRRKLLRAIAGPTVPEPALAPERRQITVLFCDIVGSMAITSRLDPEELREVMQTYFDRCIDTIEHFGGHVARIMGDGILVYFGYPHAQEEAAERAVRAACELTAEMAAPSIRSTPALNVRVGIATGLVVAGDILGDGAAREEAIVGTAPSLAFRLQTLAEPGSILISDGTRRLVGGMFSLMDMGFHELKGIDGPTPVWRVAAPRHGPRRFDVVRRATGRRTVGRGPETRMLLARWQASCGGHGQAVAVSGVAGIGKSRLVRELREALRNEPHLAVQLQCSPFHSNIALHPVADRLQRVIGVGSGQPPDKWAKRLAALLAPHALSADPDVFAPLLPVQTPTASTGPAAAGSDEDRKRLLLLALEEWMVALGRQLPLLLILEDAHWADPTTLEVFRRFLTRIASERVMVVVTHRPDLKYEWPVDTNLTCLGLEALGAAETAELIETLAEGQLPAGVIRQIANRTDGVPLFIEELTKSVIESGLTDEPSDTETAAGQAQTGGIPATLQDSLLARLERLGRGREVAQIASAIGREFSYNLLAAVAAVPRFALNAALGELRSAGLVQDLTDKGDRIFAFSHALVREAAYGTLLHSRRRELHARIAWTLEEHHPEIVGGQPALVAHHYTEANHLVPAITWWQRAAERSRRQAANTEATQQYNRALEVLARMPASDHRNRLEVDLRTALEPPLYAALGPASPQREANFAALSGLHASLGDVARMFPVLWGQCVIIYGRCELERSAEKTREYLTVADQLGSPHARAVGHLHLGHTELLRGAIGTGMDHLARALTLYRARDRSALISEFGLDLAPFAFACECLGLQQMGDGVGAVEMAEQAVREVREGGHFVTMAQVLFLVSMSRLIARDADGVNRFGDELTEISARHQSGYWNSQADLLLGWAMAHEGAVEAGLARMREGAAQRERMKGRVWVPQYRAHYAELLIREGRTPEALQRLDEADAIIASTDHRISEPEIHRQRAAALAREGAPAADVIALLRKARDAAGARGQVLFESRATADLVAYGPRMQAAGSAA